MHLLPRPLSVPNKFEENSDLRGVGSCGLEMSEVYRIGRNAEAVCTTFDQCESSKTNRQQDSLLETILVQA